jgi:N-formylglutamate deformylase
MKLPLLISVPHAGTAVPDKLRDICLLNESQIIKDGDEGAAVVYSIADEVENYVSMDVARAFVDVNRAPDDMRMDGVVKTHTICEEQIYSRQLTQDEVNLMLQHYCHPYHSELSRLSKNAILGVDCHTMAEIGPPIGPGAGESRPHICLSNADRTCPADWLTRMADCLGTAFNVEVSLNYPFKGGYIIRAHAHELPWMQLEISRAEFASLRDKRSRVLDALTMWCSELDNERD